MTPEIQGLIAVLLAGAACRVSFVLGRYYGRKTQMEVHKALQGAILDGIEKVIDEVTPDRAARATLRHLFLVRLADEVRRKAAP